MEVSVEAEAEVVVHYCYLKWILSDGVVVSVDA